MLSDKLDTNLGYIYENVVAQMLRASGKDLYYHTIIKRDGKGYYEIDFLQADGSKISPIEVKSSGYKSHASLDQFSDKYSSRTGHKYLVYTKDLKKTVMCSAYPYIWYHYSHKTIFYSSNPLAELI